MANKITNGRVNYHTSAEEIEKYLEDDIVEDEVVKRTYL
jgi:hypothetical protein